MYTLSVNRPSSQCYTYLENWYSTLRALPPAMFTAEAARPPDVTLSPDSGSTGERNMSLTD